MAKRVYTKNEYKETMAETRLCEGSYRSLGIKKDGKISILKLTNRYIKKI